MNREATSRSALFESIATRHGFKILPGRYGGDFDSDQLATRTADGRTTLLLGTLATDPGGGIQLDMHSMGGHMQCSREWIIEVARVLESAYRHSAEAELIRTSFENGTLDLVLLFVVRQTAEVKLLRIETPSWR